MTREVKVLLENRYDNISDGDKKNWFRMEITKTELWEEDKKTQ